MSRTARVHASRGSQLGRNEDWTCTGREVQFLDLTPRGQEVTASGLEDWPVRDWLVLALGGVEARKGGGGGGCSALGDPLVTDT